MARSDWERDEAGEYVRADGVDVMLATDLNCTYTYWFIGLVTPDTTVGEFDTAEAAMDYADKHYPMEKK